MRVVSFESSHLPQLLELVNLHLAAVLPGWALSGTFLAEHLERDRTDPITDPWVEERATLCAFDAGRLLAAAHLLRYGEGPEVGDSLKGAGEIDWFVFLPDREDAAAELLKNARGCLEDWGVSQEYGWPAGLPTVPMIGVPDAWPHVAKALDAAGHRPDDRRGHREALYGGRLDAVPTVGELPEPGLTVGRAAGPWGTRFSALAGREEVGFCEVVADLTHGGLLPALGGWAELQEIWVQEGWRNRGIGGWLLRHAVTWLRLAGCGRIILNVASTNEAAGAGRLYRRFGWDIFVREAHPPGVPSESSGKERY